MMWIVETIANQTKICDNQFNADQPGFILFI